MHRRHRRCIGDASAEKIGLHIDPHWRCIGDAARSSGPIYSAPSRRPTLSSAGRVADLRGAGRRRTAG
eukprot:7706288-Pyramimonas_sp.AAC.1